MICRVCGSRELKFFYATGSEKQYKYYRCNTCALINLNLEGLDIFDNQQKYYHRFNPPEDYEKERGAKEAYEFIKRYVPLKGMYLDIGCGSGNVLYFAKKDGWDVKGLEISRDLAEYVSKRLGIEVVTANFLEYDNPGEKFEMVSLRHVLEHLPDPVHALNKISELLGKGAYAHFEFPNINGISFRMKRFMDRAGIRRKKWDPSFRPGHSQEFSKASFQYLLDITGFSLIQWETYSFKPFANKIYNKVHVGSKARAIVRKK